MICMKKRRNKTSAVYFAYVWSQLFRTKIINELSASMAASIIGCQ